MWAKTTDHGWWRRGVIRQPR